MINSVPAPPSLHDHALRSQEMVKETIELIRFDKTIRKLLEASESELKKTGIDAVSPDQLTELKRRKEWSRIAGLLFEVAQSREEKGQRIGIVFWESLAKTARLMKMGNIALDCQGYRDSYNEI